jgi:primosomal protein N' (replication factor Y)
VKKGTVFVQTFLPEQPAIRFALHNDFEGFIREELKHRKACNLPPFWRLAIIDMRDTNFDRLTAACKTMRERIDGIVERNQFKAIVRGPLAAAISRIQRFHRMQIIIQTPQAADMQKLFADLRKEKSATRTADKPVSPTVKVAIDIDPVNLL